MSDHDASSVTKDLWSKRIEAEVSPGPTIRTLFPEYEWKPPWYMPILVAMEPLCIKDRLALIWVALTGNRDKVFDAILGYEGD